jgi:hypothetical protein
LLGHERLDIRPAGAGLQDVAALDLGDKTTLKVQEIMDTGVTNDD